MRSLLGKVVFGGLSLALTALIFANTYEVVYSRDIPVANSVIPVKTQVPVDGVVKDFAIKQGAKQNASNSNLRSLESLEVPAIKVRLQLEEARRIDGLWYGRPSHGSYLGLNKDLDGATVDYVVYVRESWQTLPDGAQLEPGMEVELYHSKGSKLHFVVESKEVVDILRPLVVGKVEDRQLILIVERANESRYIGFSLIQER